MKPQRIQRKRTRGWKMPPNTVYVGRPTKWGNPNRVGDLIGPFSDGLRLTSDMAVDRYRGWLIEQIALGRLNVEVLKGKDLACYFPLNQPCHADVLLEFANAEP